jgi:hypothetical protein
MDCSDMESLSMVVTPMTLSADPQSEELIAMNPHNQPKGPLWPPVMKPLQLNRIIIQMFVTYNLM